MIRFTVPTKLGAESGLGCGVSAGGGAILGLGVGVGDGEFERTRRGSALVGACVPVSTTQFEQTTQKNRTTTTREILRNGIAFAVYVLTLKTKGQKGTWGCAFEEPAGSNA